MSAGDVSPEAEVAEAPEAEVTEPAVAPPPEAPVPRRRWRRVVGLSLVLLVVGALVVPIVELDVGTSRARGCIAAYEEPRGADLPDCRREIPWFVIPSRVPWTATPARYRAEELQARVAVMGYLDALAGHPDRAALSAAAAALDASAQTLHNGSRRLALEELGHTVGAPNLGLSAELYGDRATLLARFDRWEDWDVRLRALDAAWMEGDAARATEIARRYADFDPRDEDLRTAVAATLCLGSKEDGRRGAAMFELVQTDRALHRHEAWARNWGAVRAVMVACTLHAVGAPPPPPPRANAGQADAEEARVALRLRIATSGTPALDVSERRDAAVAAIELLGRPRSPGARLRLLAAILAAEHPLDAKSAAEMARPMGEAGEPSIVPSPALTALEWLDERCVESAPSIQRVERCPGPRELGPVVPAEALEHGARALEALANGPETTVEDAVTLHAAAGAAHLLAAQSDAAAGNADRALRVLAEAERTIPGETARALARSNALFVAGLHARALSEIERAPVDATEGAAGPAIKAAILVQKAELLASLGRREEASQTAVLADDAAASAGDRTLDLHARWTRAALAPTSPLRPGTAAAPRRPGDRAWPWVGASGTSVPWLSAKAEGPALLAEALAFWADAQQVSSDERRALRYAALTHRGDAPSAPVAYLALAGGLLREREGDVELWLDALTATDARRLPLRTYTFFRAEAARIRGDRASAELWTKRRRTLVALATDPALAEIARFLGL